MKLRSLLFLAGIMLALSACSLADDITPPPGYQSPVPQPTAGPVFPATPPDAAAGAAIFVEKCAPCHGATGMGDGPQASNLPKKPTALGDLTIARAAAPADWYNVVTNGRMDAYMPPFASLDDQQRWNVVAYALSLSSQSLQGKVIYENNCASCHGLDGKKSAKSNFTDQASMAALSLNSLVAVINQGVDTMPAFEGKLSETEQYAAAAYLRSFTLVAAQESVAATATVSTSGTLGASPLPGASETASAPAGTPGVLGVISGKITNQSGTALPADLKIVLHIFAHDAVSNQFSELKTYNTTLDANGKYMFASVDVSPTYAFYVSVDYGNTTYNSEPITPTANVTTYDLSLDIYDTTSDLAVLAADQVHIILDYSKPDVIQVVEYYAILNSSNKTVIPISKGAPVVTVTLPKGYANLQFQDGALGERFIQTADGFGDTSPIPPSKDPFQLIFAYDLPYSANFDFVEPFSLNVTSTQFLVSEGVKAQAPGILDGGVKDMGSDGGKFQIYSVGSYKRGEMLKVNVSGSPINSPGTTPIAGTDSSRNLIIGVGALGLVLMLVAAWWFWRDRKRAPKKQPVAASLGMTRDEIIDAIIALDDQHNAGNITHEAYQKRRNELKEKFQKTESSE